MNTQLNLRLFDGAAAGGEVATGEVSAAPEATREDVQQPTPGARLAEFEKLIKGEYKPESVYSTS